MNSGRRLLLHVGLLITSCLLATGCFIIPCKYPKLSYLPSVDLGSELTDCHVFRVDCRVHQTDNHGEYGEYTLTEVSPAPDGGIPSHARVSLEKKNVFVGIVLGYHEVGTVHRTQLRLYRPGYALVELESWDLAAKVQWQPAMNWADQEKAIDGLLSGPPAACDTVDWLRSDRKRAFRHLPELVRYSDAAVDLYFTALDVFGQIPKISDYSASEVQPLVFAATEYERVAKLAPTPADAARSKRKAEVLRSVTTPPEKACTP